MLTLRVYTCNDGSVNVDTKTVGVSEAEIFSAYSALARVVDNVILLEVERKEDK